MILMNRSRLVSKPHDLTMNFFTIFGSFDELFANFSKAVQSHKKVLEGLFIQRSLSIAEVKEKIRSELHFPSARLLLNDAPLHDTQLVSETNIQAGSLVRAAMQKQNLKRKRPNHKPGDSSRRRMKKKEAQQQLKDLLNSMTPDERASTLTQIEEDEHDLEEPQTFDEQHPETTQSFVHHEPEEAQQNDELEPGERQQNDELEPGGTQKEIGERQQNDELEPEGTQKEIGKMDEVIERVGSKEHEVSEQSSCQHFSSFNF